MGQAGILLPVEAPAGIGSRPGEEPHPLASCRSPSSHPAGYAQPRSLIRTSEALETAPFCAAERPGRRTRLRAPSPTPLHGSIGDPIDKPQGMRWATFDGKMDQIERIETRVNGHLWQLIQRLGCAEP